jgi:hypothetical protein
MASGIYITLDEKASKRIVAYSTLQKSARLLHDSGISNAYLMYGKPSDGKLAVSFLEIKASDDNTDAEKLSISGIDSPFEKEVPCLTIIYTEKDGFDIKKIKAIVKHSQISPLGVILPEKAYARKLENILQKEDCKATRL